MLVDSGATCTFVDGSFAHKHNLTLTALSKPLKVRLANGASIRCLSFVSRARISLPGYEGLHDLIVMDGIDGFDVILGRSFLAKSGALVDHGSSNLSWPGKPALSREPHYASANSSMNSSARSVPGQVEESPAQPGPQSGQARDITRNISSREERLIEIRRVQTAVANGSGSEQDTLRLAGLGAVDLDNAVVSTTTRTSTPECQHRRALNARLELHDARMKPRQGQLPPSRGDFDHRIELRDPAAKPAKSKAIPLNPLEREQLAADIQELEAGGLIVRSRSEWAAPVFYVNKDGGKAKRLVVDYRSLNQLIKRNSTSLPHIKELMARLRNARIFSKLDLKSGYHQVRLRPADQEKTAFVTPLGHFEWTVMPFGEANAPATFIQLMKQLVLKDMVNRNVIDFVDDILIYSEDEQQHVKDVSDVLDRLEKHCLFIKPTKCTWMASEVEFLGHRIRAGSDGTEMLPMESKVEAVNAWPVPVTQTQLRSFLGFTNTFRTFVKDYSSIATPLLKLTKQVGKLKSSKLVWTQVEQAAFEALKVAVTTAPVLTIPDDEKPFVLHTDASDYGVGAVLSQRDTEGQLRPIGFMSKKLNDTEYKWSTYEKELFAVVTALRHWSMHLMGARHRITIFTDHHSLMFIISQPKLTAKQTRWYDTLGSFDIEFKHVSGANNSGADALSRRSDLDVGVDKRQTIRSEIAKAQFASQFGTAAEARLTVLSAESSVEIPSIMEAIIAGYDQDEQCKKIRADPARYQYELRWGALHRIIDGAVLVPDFPELKVRLLQEVHDAPTSGHLGINKTHSRLAANFFWPNQFIDVRDWVNSCARCQAAKHRNSKPAGLLSPIEIVPKGHTITMDFVGPMPMTARGRDGVLVIVDKFTKRAFYEAISMEATAKDVATIVFNRIVRHQGLPRSIISDRDTRFMSDFWSSLWDALGSKLKKSTSYHPQSDGQTERQNRSMLDALRAYVNKKGTDWDKHLIAIEIAYNSSIHASTSFSPFKLDGGIDIRLPGTVATERMHPRMNTSASDFLDQFDKDIVDAHAHLLAAQQRQQTYANQHRREEKYEIGDFAWLETRNLHSTHRGSRKLLPQWAGPFLVTGVRNDVNVVLALPEGWRIHNNFHVSKLKKAATFDDSRFPGRTQAANTQPTMIAGQLGRQANNPASSPEATSVEPVHISEPLGHSGHHHSSDLSAYDERGAVVSELEREAKLTVRPRTRSQVQRAHDAGGAYDFVEQTSAWDNKRTRTIKAIARSQSQSQSQAQQRQPKSHQ
jgi:hypothetical protein